MKKSDLNIYKNIFKGFLMQNHKRYHKIKKRIWGVQYTLFIYFDEKENTLYLFIQRDTPYILYTPYALVFHSMIRRFVEAHENNIRPYITPETKIYIMGECSSGIFFNILLAEYSDWFPNKKNIFYIILSPPIFLTDINHYYKIKSLGINFIIFRMVDDKATTTQLDSPFKEHMILFEELYSPPIKDCKDWLDHLLFGNHDGAHHLEAMKRYFLNNTKIYL